MKQLDRNGMNMGKDFLSEVALLSHLNHDNLVNLIGYCVDGDQRLLVYEYMSRGSLYDRLFGMYTPLVHIIFACHSGTHTNFDSRLISSLSHHHKYI